MKGLKLFRFLIIFSCLVTPFFIHSSVRDQQSILKAHRAIKYLKESEELQRKGKFEEAVEILNKSLALDKTNLDKEKECEYYIRLGLLYWNLGQMSTSKERYETALKIAKKSGLTKQELECQNALDIYSHYVEAKKLRDKDQLNEAKEEFERAIEIAQQIGSKEHELKCLRQLGLTHWLMNNWEQFYLNNKKGLELATVLKHRKEIGRCSNNIGLYWRYKTDYSQSLRFYQEALQIARELKNKQDQADVLNNMGVIYKDLGDFNKALDYLSRALTIDQELGNTEIVPRTLNNLGITLRLKIHLNFNDTDFQKAIGYFQESLKLSRKIGDKETEIKVLNNLGSINSDVQNYSKALEYFSQGRKKAEQSDYKESLGMILNNMGIVHFNLGNYEKSTKFFQEAINLANGVGGGQILWEAYLELGNTLREQNKPKEALINYKNSIKNIELIRSNIKNEEQKASFLGTDKRIEAYQNLIDLLIHLHESEPDRNYDLQAFNYMEQAKARAFLDSLELSKIDISSHVDFKLLSQEKELEKDITKVYNHLLGGNLTSEEKEKLKDLEFQLEALKLEIRTENPAYAQLIFPKAIPMDEVQKKLLDNKTAFFAYSVGKRSSYAFTLTKKKLKIFEIPSKKDLQNMVSNYLKIITDKGNQDFDLGYTLFSQLVKPGINAKIKNIIFIPGDILNFLPFETLLTQQGMNRWLIEDYTITYAPSISSLYELVNRKKNNGSKRKMDLLALGDPYFGSLETEENGDDILKGFFSTNTFNLDRLEYSGIEIERIGALFSKNKRTIFQRESASEDQLKNTKLEDYKIVHFATHSLIDDKKPDRSSIVLALDTDQREDGLLRMKEIYNLDLNSDLVTLSACQTALGQLIRGEGIEGINRAFFYAGASSVLMSLWAVNDQATYQLMERFYTHIRSADSIMRALRKAKLEMIHSRTLSHPYYWAGFIISGKADHTIFPRNIYKLVALCFVCVLTIGIVTVIARRKKNFSERS